MKFFLHGSYEVQHGHRQGHPKQSGLGELDKQLCVKDDRRALITSADHSSTDRSRCMFEETYTINISVKQPDAMPAGKQIDVHIEKASPESSTGEEKMKSHVTFPDGPSSATTLALDQTTKKGVAVDTLASQTNEIKNNLDETLHPSMDQGNEVQFKQPSNTNRKPIQTYPMPMILQAPSLSRKVVHDEKLFTYLDYIQTNGESNHEPSREESISVVDLEQLCRSLTVHDLKDESIRKKIYELKRMVDERHRRLSQPIIPIRKSASGHDRSQYHRRSQPIDPSAILLQSRTVDLHVPYNYSYQDIIAQHNHHYSLAKQQGPPARKPMAQYHYT